MISIILVEPEQEGNVGAIARVMKNFGFSKLILVNPKCNHLSEEARKRAKNAQDVLKKAKICSWAKINFDFLIGTTAKIGTDFNIPRSPLTPNDLRNALQHKGRNVGLIFGRESHGLNNKEIEKCDFVVKIPANSRYETLNISHAVAIILYELQKKNKITEIRPIGNKERTYLFNMINQTLNKLKFNSETKKQTQKLVWKRILAKSFLSQREAYALFGYFRKLLEKLK